MEVIAYTLLLTNTHRAIMLSFWCVLCVKLWMTSKWNTIFNAFKILVPWSQFLLQFRQYYHCNYRSYLKLVLRLTFENSSWLLLSTHRFWERKNIRNPDKITYLTFLLDLPSYQYLWCLTFIIIWNAFIKCQIRVDCMSDLSIPR